MFSKQTYINRRQELKKLVGTGVVILFGNNESPANFPANGYYPFRQDSSFLYFFGQQRDGLIGVIDIDNDIETLVGDDIEGNLRAIINYGITAIIQARQGYADAIDMSNDEAMARYDSVLAETKELMLRKNHDYGEAWREMSKEGIVDMILAKIIRIKTILTNEGKTIASEGVEGNYFDIINYAIFDLIHYSL